MAAVKKSNVDVEEGGRRPSVNRSDRGSDGSPRFSDADDQSCHSPLDSTARGSYNEFRSSNVSDPEIAGVSDPSRSSSASDRSAVVDLESGVQEIKVHLAKVEKDCRICHLSLDSANQETGIPIELGCSCKEDLAAAHKQCAEAWFKIKGNKTCEICGVTARNIVGANESGSMEQWNETNDETPTAPPAASTETQSFWHGHRFLNFLLACMVFAFVISWLFHFNVPS